MAETYTTDQVINAIRARTEAPGCTQTSVAAEVGVSLTYLNGLLLGRATLSELMAERFGFKRQETLFTKIGEKHGK